MKRDTYDQLVRSMRRGDRLHDEAAAVVEGKGDMRAAIAGALLALDQRVACFLLGYMEHERERLEREETT